MFEKIGVSVASLLPWSWGPGAPERVAWLVGQADLDGVQLLPLRGLWDINKVYPWRDPRIISMERKWGYHFQDWILFGESTNLSKRFELGYSDAIQVSHDWSNPNFELHPEIGTTRPLKYLEDLYDYPYKFVLDTWHLRREGRNGEPPITAMLNCNCREVVEYLLSNGSLEMIHFQPRRDRPWKIPWDGAEANSLRDMLRPAAQSSMSIPVIIEIKPYIGSMTGLIRHLKQTKEFILSI